MENNSQNFIFDVSVIIATYNSNSKKLIDTLISAQRQKDIVFEIIVTDDCSKKSPINIITQFKKKV